MITGLGGIQISQLPQPGSPLLNLLFPFRKAQLEQEAQRCMESIAAGAQRIQEVGACLAVVGNAAAADQKMVTALNQLFKTMPWMGVPPISAENPALGIYKAMKYAQMAMERVSAETRPEIERNRMIGAAKDCLEVLKQVLVERSVRIDQVNQALKQLAVEMPSLAPRPPAGGATDPAMSPGDAPDTTAPTSGDPATSVPLPSDPATTDATTAAPTADTPTADAPTAGASAPSPLLGRDATRAQLMKVVDALKEVLRPLEDKLRQDMAMLTVINIKRQGVFSVFADLWKAQAGR